MALGNEIPVKIKFTADSANIKKQLETALGKTHAIFLKLIPNLRQMRDLERDGNILIEKKILLSQALNKSLRIRESLLKKAQLIEQYQALPTRRSSEGYTIRKELSGMGVSTKEYKGVLADFNSATNSSKEFKYALKDIPPIVASINHEIKQTKNFIEATVSPVIKQEANIKKALNIVAQRKEAEKKEFDRKVKASQSLERQRERETKKTDAAIKKQEAAIKKQEQELERARKAANRYHLELDKVSQATERLGGRTHGLLRFFSRMRNQLLVMTFAISGFIYYMRRALINITAMESAFAGLDSVSKKLNIGVYQTRDAAKALSADGLIPLTDTVNALKSLLATGFSLDQAIQLMQAFKDAAAFNRQGMLSIGEAVAGAASGLKNQNSIMVDNVGITKNLSIILKEAGYSMADLGKITSDVNVRNALFSGIVKEAALFQGDAAKAANTLSGALSRMGVSGRNLSVVVGNLLTPVVADFSKEWNKSTESLQEFIEVNTQLLSSRIYDWYKNVSIILTAIGKGIEFILRLFILIPPKVVLLTVVFAGLYKEVKNLLIAFGLIEGMLKSSLLFSFFRGLILAGGTLLGVFAKLPQIFMALVTSAGFLVTAITAVVAGLITLWATYESAETKAKRLNDEQLKLLETSGLQLDSLIAEFEQMEKNNTATQTQIDLLQKLREEKEKNVKQTQFNTLTGAFYQLRANERKIRGEDITFPGSLTEVTRDSLNLEYLKKELKIVENELTSGLSPAINDVATAYINLGSLVDKTQQFISIKPKETVQLLEQQKLALISTIAMLEKEKQAKEGIVQTEFDLLKLQERSEEEQKKYEEVVKQTTETIKELEQANAELLIQTSKMSDEQKAIALQHLQYNKQLKDYDALIAESIIVGGENTQQLIDEREEYRKLTQSVIDQSKAMLVLKQQQEDADAAKKLRAKVEKADKDITDFKDKLIKQNLEINSQYQEMLSGVQDLNVVQEQHREQIRLLREEAAKLGLVNEKGINQLERTYALIRKVMQAEQDRQRKQQLTTLATQAGAIKKYGNLSAPGAQRDIAINAENNQYAEDARKLRAQKRQAYLSGDYDLWAEYKQGLENLEISHKEKLLQIEADFWEAKWGFVQAYSAGMSEFNNTMLSMTQSTTLKQLQFLEVLSRATEDAFKAMLMSFFQMQSTKFAGYAAEQLLLGFTTAINPLTAAFAPGHFAAAAKWTAAAAAMGIGAGLVNSAFARGSTGGVGGSNTVGGDGGSSSSGGGNTINGTVQARELKITIAPVLTIMAEDDVFIGSGSVQEFSDIVGGQVVNTVKDAIETGQINLNKYSSN